MKQTGIHWRGFALIAVVLCPASLNAQSPAPQFKVLAFYTAKIEPAHISFVHEANRWFPQMAAKYNFAYEATTNWNQLNPAFLSQHQVVLFLDTRPEAPAQRKAFEDFMEHGGAWMGFHFAGFALTPSDYPQNWDWYHQKFLGSGEYLSNTWRPTSAVLRVEDSTHPATRNLPATFKSAPNEWYRWKNNLRANPDIKVLLSIDPASFPLGTGPKPNEIWHSGDYPVVWTNQKYKMIYLNMGHNDLDDNQHTNKELSFTLANETQNQLIVDSLQWLGGRNYNDGQAGLHLYNYHRHSYNNGDLIQKTSPSAPGAIHTPFRYAVPPATKRRSQACPSSKSGTASMDLYR